MTTIIIEESMHCEKCKKRDATVHLTEIVKKVKAEIHLCEKCASQFGLNSKLSSFSLSVPDMLSFLNVAEVGNVDDTDVCLACGLSYLEYRRSGKLGCSECYKYMKFALGSIISSYHGESKHIGKVPFNYNKDTSPEPVLLEAKASVIKSGKRLEDLKSMLDSAVFEERYEDAARFRDMMSRLKELED